MVVIIGAGIAGLTCAKYLKDRGISATVLESSDAVGGRVRTDRVDSFLLDRGFQVFLTSYPEARGLLDFDRLDLVNLPSGARIRTGNDFFRMPNPLKDIFTLPAALGSPVGNLADKVRILELKFSTSKAAEPTRNGSSGTTRAFLENYGFSETVIERFFLPFFRGVFLERDLETRADLFRFLYSQFANAEVVLPRKGMQAIPEQIAAGLDPGQIRLDTLVKGIEGKTVHLENGERIEAGHVVVATEASASAKLLGHEANVSFNGTTCMYFECGHDVDFGEKAYLIINSNPDEVIDHVFPASLAVPEYAPEGKTLISANIVGRSGVTEEAVRDELAHWFGGEIAWQHLKTYQIPEALPKFFADSEDNSDLKLDDGIFRCGDYTSYPSLNGAMRSGRLVAEMIAE